ncbi:unnamed protein product, partial [marine sediment metagenome]
VYDFLRPIQDDFERLVAETSTDLLDDSDNIRGRFLEC